MRERPADGGFLGRLLGMLVVLGAVAVLGVGALTFVGGNSPSPGPSPTVPAGALVSPSPVASPSPAPSTPTPVPSPSPEPSPSPSPSPFTVEVMEGPGYVTFGTNANSQLRITDPRTTFELGERMTISAQLTEPAASADMIIHFYRYDLESGEEELITEQQVRPRVPSASVFSRRVNTDNIFDAPGIYVMRYLRGNEVMSEGWFELTD